MSRYAPDRQRRRCPDCQTIEGTPHLPGCSCSTQDSGRSLLDVTERERIERAVAGALKTVVLAHGPVTLDTRQSAAKRITSALQQTARQQAGEER